MTTEQLYNELNYVNHSREKRLFYANMMINHPELIPKLLDILFRVDDKISPRAAWVLEFMCSKDIETIIPYLDRFTENIYKVHLDPAVRPVAKICELLAKYYNSREDNRIKTELTKVHQERIIETCFDYMINDEKVAPKAYGMVALFLFGKHFDWVHPELKIILDRDYPKQSPAFKARARQILKKIKK
ncbi:adenylosuccinate lyase [Algibacter sp. L4_22]|uniref:adenylosuccinate lyase n=1 Tax=Algibacter sp. L4_22 TaxID=2942477 RepID=UPI00201B8624|nr:adenylosuccinate lyase [Algibacter sp. L4_22]MCL5128606.1 adenylosuccinate lyase [Algibacter sp. L4_22]